MAKRFELFFTGRFCVAVRLLIILTAAVLLNYTNSHAQSFQLDLNDYRRLHREMPWDTIPGPPIDRLYLGEHHSVPNFLSTDFRRQRVLEEYSPDGLYRFTFNVPLTVPFRSEEVQEGAYILMTPRDFTAPGIEISVESLDEMAERRREESLKTVWVKSVVAAIETQDEEVEAKRGLLNVSIPLPLPGAVEKLIGRGDQTNIDISGRESITFQGETRRVHPFVGVEGQQKQPLFPSLDMKQELDVQLRGQIGEKVNVEVDHTSSSAAANANRIRLNYQGFDDDIIKLIELGNTSLSLPGSQLVSFSTSSQGLFGIKTLAQVGPMDITVIASKEEGEASHASFSPRGGAIGQTEQRDISDLNFVANTYFFLDDPSALAENSGLRPQEGSIDVYRSVEDYEINLNNLITTWGAAFVDSIGNGSQIGGEGSAEKRQFVLLQPGDDYRFVLDARDDGVNGIELVRALASNEVLAVAYVNLGGDTIGEYNAALSKDEENPLNLELIWPANALPTGPYRFTWRYMMRNIYNLGLSNIDPSTLEVEIYERANRLDPSTPDSSAVPWIRIFGLDQTDESGTGPPDNRVDLLTGVIDVQRGTLTFPDLTPFDPNPFLVNEWTDGEFAFTGRYANLVNKYIYTKRPESTEFQASSRFRIIVRAASTTRSFNLNAFGITEGSEKITLDGRTLQRNRDYTIDYETGEVELRGEVLDELTPSSDIQVDYEFTPFAGGASSTLIGFNSILNMSKNSRIGTTWLYESTSSASIRPRLGEEPTRAVVGGFDANLQYDVDFLTSLVNMMPLVDTDAKSTFSFSGGMAVSMPDPNTKGQVYIDDMEGVEDSDVIPLSRRSWRVASPPVDPDEITATLPGDKREGIFWYNIEPDRGVHRRDLNPDLDERESTLVPSIDIEIDKDLPSDSTQWTGIMTGFRGGGLDLSQGQFIEIWVNDFRPEMQDRQGILHIDMGYIDEDFYEPDLNDFNNEDANRDGFTALTEDTGLDGVFDGEPGDDPNDNYSSQRVNDRFSQVNGTEGNFLWDTEDLDGTGQLETSNAYFTFEVNLADSAIVDIRRDFNKPTTFYTDELDSWRQYRVPLAEFKNINKDGSPSIEQIKHLRIWFENIGETVSPARKRIEICGFKIVGNRWEQDGLRGLDDKPLSPADTVDVGFALGVISTKTDPTRYIPHVNPNVQNDIAEKEQSLLVGYRNIPAGGGFRIRKRFGGTGMDFTTYRDLNFFVHADNMNAEHEYYFQLAYDSLNFYEVQIPITKTYFTKADWCRVLIPFTDLTDLKFEPADSIVTGIAHDAADPGRTYKVRMVGQPNLFSVRVLYAGFRNRSTDETTTASGELWINDIYLGDRKRDIDFAERVTGTVNMGNVINLSGSWQRTGPDFRSLRQKRGSGTDNQSVAINAKTGLDYFFPLFGFKLPVSGNFSRNTSLPKFTPNGDTEITNPTIQDSLKSQNTVRGLSATLTRTGSKNPLLKYTFDKLKANFSVGETAMKSPASADTTVTLSGTLDYGITWSGEKRIRLFKNFGFRYWPNSFNYRINANRRKGRRYRLIAGEFVPDPLLWSAGISNNGSVTYVPFPSLTSSFRMQTQRDLRQPHEWLGVDIGMETNRSHSLQANYKPPPLWLLRSLSPDFSYNSSYSEDASPNVQKVGDPAGVRNVTSNRNMSLKFRVDVGGFLGKVFGGVGLLEEEEKVPKRAPGGEPNFPEQRPPDDQTGQGGGEPAAADSTVAEPEAKPKPKVDPLMLVKKTAGILSSIRKINASVQQRDQSGYTRIPERPSVEYQLGFTSNSGVIYKGVPWDMPERNSKNLSISMDSGVQLTNDIDVAVRFGHATTNSVFRNNETNTKTLNWPDLNLSWKSMEKFGPLRRFFEQTSATLGYNKQTTESGKAGEVQSHKESTNLTPTMIFRWKNGMQSSVSVQYANDLTDTRGAINENTNLSVNLDLKYTFEPGKSMKIPLPFLRNKALKSRLDTSVSAGYNRTSGRRSSDKPGYFISLPGTTTFRIGPRVTYNFTRALNGSFFANYSRTHSDASNQTTTLVQIGITAVFTF